MYWRPKSYIYLFFKAKELRIPTYFVRPASIRIYNDSQIRYATRVNFDVACKMEFQYYPADVQTCEIKLESFGYTNRQMKFSWMKGTVWIFDNYVHYTQYRNIRNGGVFPVLGLFLKFPNFSILAFLSLTRSFLKFFKIFTLVS